jgi:hypothetical protein
LQRHDASLGVPSLARFALLVHGKRSLPTRQTRRSYAKRDCTNDRAMRKTPCHLPAVISCLSPRVR